MTPVPSPAATGLGSWPGTSVAEALRVVRGELTGADGELRGLPYLPELPARGAGTDLIGRTAGLLIEMPVDLGPAGWRLVPRPGRDAERTAAWWRQDLDVLAEAFDGWTGEFKVQVAGPWTMAAGLWLPRGDRVVSDVGAVRDLAESLSEGVRAHVRHLRSLLPGATIVLQVDEPSLPAVLRGGLRSDSGVRTLPAPDPGLADATVQRVVAAGRSAGAGTVAVHCCATAPPLKTMRASGADALSVDVRALTDRSWEHLAEAMEAGIALWAGAVRVPSQGHETTTDTAADAAAVVHGWRRIGLSPAMLRQVTVTPTCGLAGVDPARARELTATTLEVAARLRDED